MNNPSNNRFQRTSHKVRRPLNRDVRIEKSMKRISAFILGIIYCCLTAHGESNYYPSINARFSELLPAGWMAVQVGTAEKPYGWVQDPGDDSGFELTVQGPNMVIGSNGETTPEHLTIWIMPASYVPVNAPPPGPPMDPSILLGTTKDGYLVYAKCWSEIVSWQDWEQDLRNYFKIQKSEQSVPGYPPQGVGSPEP